jgi:uncharacterized protein (TIGR02466 family)
MQTIHLFPKVVGVFNLDRNLTKKELSKINSNLNELENNKENHISKNKFVLNDPALSDLKQFIDESIKQYLCEILEENTELKITQSWLNKTFKNEGHHYHCHPNSYLSGVFYVQTNDNDNIVFYNNDPRISYYESSVNNWNLINSATWWLPTPQNSLIIFRSDLHHSVPKTPNDERISLSFNTFPNGLGNERSATYVPSFN